MKMSIVEIRQTLRTKQFKAVIANDKVYWERYNDNSSGVELKADPIEFLAEPMNEVNNWTILVYSNSCSKYFRIPIGGFGNRITVSGDNKIELVITGEDHFVRSINPNLLVTYNGVSGQRAIWHGSYIQGKFLKKVNGKLYDVDTDRYYLQLSSGNECQIVIPEIKARAGIWDCCSERVIDQGNSQANCVLEVERFSRVSRRKFE